VTHWIIWSHPANSCDIHFHFGGTAGWTHALYPKGGPAMATPHPSTKYPLLNKKNLDGPIYGKKEGGKSRTKSLK